MKLKNMKVFDLADVSVHNNRKDCWVIINARVYDVTNFLNEHPGGDNVLLDVAGKNASEEFEEAGHGSASRLMLDEYYVGETNFTSSTYGITTTTHFQTRTHLKQKTVVKENMQLRLDYIMKSVGLFLLIAIFGCVIGFIVYK